jgi:hypothetical protein
MKSIALIILSPIIVISFYYSFLSENLTKPKFIYSISSLIIPTTEKSSLKIGNTTFVTFRDKPTLIDMVIEKINEEPFNPRQRVVKKYKGTNEVPLYDPEDYPTNNIANADYYSLPQSPASLPVTYVNPYFFNRPLPTPTPSSSGGFR